MQQLTRKTWTKKKLRNFEWFKMGHIFINLYHNRKQICLISIYFLNMYVKNCNSQFHQWYQNKMMSHPNLQPLDKCTS